RDDEGRGEPVVVECAVEHDLERAEKGRDQHETDEIEPASLLLEPLPLRNRRRGLAEDQGDQRERDRADRPLIIKHQRQKRLSASQPPNVGPTAGTTTTATPNNAKPWL